MNSPGIITILKGNRKKNTKRLNPRNIGIAFLLLKFILKKLIVKHKQILQV